MRGNAPYPEEKITTTAKKNTYIISYDLQITLLWCLSLKNCEANSQKDCAAFAFDKPVQMRGKKCVCKSKKHAQRNKCAQTALPLPISMYVNEGIFKNLAQNCPLPMQINLVAITMLFRKTGADWLFAHFRPLTGQSERSIFQFCPRVRQLHGCAALKFVYLFRFS